MILSVLENGGRREYPVSDVVFDRECDLLCVGIGSAGGYAALAAAREGLKVIAVEKDANIGGMPVNGRVTFYYYGFFGGSFEENDRRGKPERDIFGTSADHNNSDLMQIMLYRSLCEQGVELVTHTVLTGVYLEGGRVVGARLFGNGKSFNIASKILVDSTSDGHVIRTCPVKTYLGRDADGKTVPFTVRCEMLDGEGRYRYNNSDSGYCDQYRVSEFSHKIIDAHGARKHIPKKQMRLVSLAPVCGVREGVRYEGEEKLRYDDIFLEKSPEKVLFYAYSDIDKHGHDLALDDELYQNWWVISNLATVTVRIPVPFGAVVPKNLKGIVTAGRCLSIDSYSSSAVRMNRDMFRMGECVGIAAAMAVKADCEFLEVDYGEFVKKAESYGCYSGDTSKNMGFDDQTGKKPYRPVNFKMSHDELIAMLSTECPGAAVWAAYRYGDETLAKRLVAALDGEDGHLKFNSAIALGIMGRKEGLGVLRQLVENRDCFYFKDCRRSNQYRSAVAICLIGRLGGREDIDLLYPIVFDNGEFERRLYHTLEPMYITCSLEGCNSVLYQHFTHAAAAILKLAKKHGVSLRKDFEERFLGADRELIVSQMTNEPPTGAFRGEVVDFMDHILGLLSLC